LPNRSHTEYIVQERATAGVAGGVVDVVVALVVVVGVVVVDVVEVVGAVALVEPAVVLDVEDVLGAAGAGDTIAAVVLVADEDALAVALGWAAGLADSLGIPPANGLRGMLAISTLTGTVFAADTGGVALTVTAGGSGVGVPSAGALFSSSSGTAMIAASSKAATSHMRRSRRSLRSELINDLQWGQRPRLKQHSAGRSLR
jgi:hypothetical protein